MEGKTKTTLLRIKHSIRLSNAHLFLIRYELYNVRIPSLGAGLRSRHYFFFFLTTLNNNTLPCRHCIWERSLTAHDAQDVCVDDVVRRVLVSLRTKARLPWNRRVPLFLFFSQYFSMQFFCSAVLCVFFTWRLESLAEFGKEMFGLTGLIWLQRLLWLGARCTGGGGALRKQGAS